MTTTQKGILGCLTLALILVCAAGAGLLVLFNVPALNDQIPLNSATLLITLSNPLDGSHYPENGFVPVQAIIRSGKPLVAMELWIDGTLIETKTPDPGADLGHLTVRWSFPLSGPGERVLIVRAKDATGQIGTSNAVRVNTSPAVGARTAYAAQTGDTVEKIAASFSTTKQKIVDANPSLNPTSPITPGQYVFIPIPPHAPYPPAPAQPAPPGGPVQIVSESPPSILGPWLVSLTGPSTLPQPPKLATSANGCNVNLVITDQSSTEQGFFVYRLDAGQAFQRIATLAANSGALPLQYTDSNLTGKVQHYVAAFNAAGESKSNLAGTVISGPECATANTSGLVLQNGVLSLPQPVDKAYVYGSVNKTGYKRIPTDPQQFLTPKQGKIDLAKYVGEIAAAANTVPHEIDLEAWGWKGNSLISLGTLHTVMDQTALSVCKLGAGCVGDMGLAQRDTKDAIAPDQPNQVREFYWKTSTPGVTGVVWQVATVPFSNAWEVQPAGLVATANLPATGTASGASGSFQMNFAKLKSSGQPPQPGPTLAAPQPTSTAGTTWLSQVVLAANAHLGTYGFYYPIVYHVRAVPMIGNQPSPQPSNSVIITYGSKGAQPSIDLSGSLPPNIYDVQVVGFTGVQPPTLPWGCVIITGLAPEWLDEDDRKLFQYHLNTGAPYCPAPWKGIGEVPWYEQMFDFISGGISWVSEAWSDIKGAVVNAVAGLLQCPDCKDLLMTGLNMGLMALGIPPDLPNLDQLMDQGAGYLVNIAVQQLPAPELCPDICQEKLREGIVSLAKDATRRSVDQSQNAEEAHKHGSEPLRLPNMVAAKPAPGSALQPASVSVKITRKPLPAGAKAADPKRYRLVITNSGVNEWLKGRDAMWTTALECNDSGCWPADAVYVKINETPTGALFELVDVPVPDLASGSSSTVQFFLTPKAYWLPEHGYPSKYPSESYYWNDWQYLYDHGTIGIRASIQCAGSWAACGGSHEITVPYPYQYTGQ